MCELNADSTMKWLEALYYIAGIVMGCASVIGLAQLWLLKRDIRLRNERAALEQAIIYGVRFLTEFARNNETYHQDLLRANLEPYSGETGDFSAGSIPAGQKELVAERLKVGSWIHGVNELEAIAAAYMTGVAYEAKGFAIIGRMFCEAVRNRYDVIAACRADPGIRQYQNIVDLYRIWHSKLAKAELEVEAKRAAENQKSISAKIVAQGNEQVPPFGV